MAFDILKIESPDFLKQLNITQLEQLCAEIRSFIIENVSETGGHLSSNLGVVEATVAMHYVFESPKDKLIYDVGHQGYTHKILTGRAKEFKKLRKKDGLNGFLSYDESEHDVWEAGHSSTALSAASGFLESKENNETIGEVVAFIGDGSIQNGLAFEGLNYIGSQKNQKVIIILNDNEMSISQNVGRMALNLRNKKENNNESFKTLQYNDDFFASMNYKYLGPIDGHNIGMLIEYFKKAKDTDSSVILHVNTIKGKGYPFAEEDKFGLWHGTGPFNIETGKQINTLPDNIIPWGKGISDLLFDLLEKTDNIKIISPAMIVGSFFQNLSEKFPNKIIDVGINEEHAVVMAASMSRNNIVPIVSMYSTFLQRAYDEVCHDVCRNNNHVVFLLDHAGIVSNDGSTHQGVFDISMLLSMPNIVICSPSNLYEAKKVLDLAIEIKKPFVIRYPKDNIDTNIGSSHNYPIEFGKWIINKPISDVNIISYGDTINEFEEKLNDRNIGLINALFVKPIDLNVLQQLKNKRVIVVEEVMKTSSLATLLMQYNHQYGLNMTIESYAIDDVFVGVGTRKEIKIELRIDVDTVLNNI